MRQLSVVATAAALMGCAQSDPITTTSGKPDVLLHAVSASCVREKILNHALTTGWQIKSTSDFQIVVQKQAPMSGASLLLVGNYGGNQPYQRLTFNLVPSGGDLRMVIDGAWVIRPNTSFEQLQPVTRWSQTEQASLEAAGRRAEETCKV